MQNADILNFKNIKETNVPFICLNINISQNHYYF